MVTILGVLSIALGALVATLCATADGALLSLDPDDRLRPAIAELRSRRERIHRALAFARVLAAETAERDWILFIADEGPELEDLLEESLANLPLRIVATAASSSVTSPLDVTISASVGAVEPGGTQ